MDTEFERHVIKIIINPLRSSKLVIEIIHYFFPRRSFLYMILVPKRNIRRRVRRSPNMGISFHYMTT
ncbi:hypothetical protein HOLleu_03632 [Holothuria leucospilota]|uniref:Uncharacterized protein n=1 Tax=Holothuria leucospilota TaxID=206669 RepID=A0A9Q1HHQ7_HOLLE|nr:hypothetical protein HOLleu_03632 [Holothuria leucospilota]